MGIIPSREAAGCAATQELLSMLWSPKFLYRIHKSPPLVPMLNQINPLHITTSYPSKTNSNVIYSLTPLSSYYYFFLPFSPMTCIYSSSHHSCYMPCPSHPPWLDNSSYNGWRVHVMKLLTEQLYPSSRTFSLAPCSQTRSVFVPPLMSAIKIHTNADPQAKLYCTFQT
jgi:hypothetical protein